LRGDVKAMDGVLAEGYGDGVIVGGGVMVYVMGKIRADQKG
jgi:hypothetical protein